MTLDSHHSCMPYIYPSWNHMGSTFKIQQESSHHSPYLILSSWSGAVFSLNLITTSLLDSVFDYLQCTPSTSTTVTIFFLLKILLGSPFNLEQKNKTLPMAYKPQMIYFPLCVWPHCLVLSCLFTPLLAHEIVYHMYGSMVRNEITAGWNRAERTLYEIARWRDIFLFKNSGKTLKHFKQESKMIRNLFWKDKFIAHIKEGLRE